MKKDKSKKDHLLNLDEEEIDVEELISELDKESAYRRLSGVQNKVVSIIAVIFSLFQIYTSIFGVLPAQLQRTIHLSFILILIYLMYPVSKSSNKREFKWYDIALAVIGGAVTLYYSFNYEALILRAGRQTMLDLIIGGIAIILVLEGARRVVGFPITIIATIFLIYGKIGPYLPGFLNHRGYSVSRIIGHMYYTTEGIIGIPLGVASTFVFLFILFGTFLEKTGIGQFFMDISNAVAGWARGGPAKVAVMASALEGTVSGSSVANTVGSGSFTIPLMKRLGYKPEFAAAVEAAASTGGQLMPPIMGAAAFLMSEFIGLEYSKIALSAIIPALLYFTGIWITVDLEAKKLGMKGIPKDELPNAKKVIIKQGYLVLPLIGIIYFLVTGSTPIRAAMAGIALSILASLVKKESRMSIAGFFETLEKGAKGAIGVSVACACAGIIVGSITLTGLGLKLGNGLVELAGGSLMLTMMLTMVACIILGMGIPTTANYVITSTIASPALIQLGVPTLAAHMFVFYFGIVADITPPVALAAYAGSAIAKSNPLKTGVQATKLAIAAFIIPYIFVLNPQMLLIDTNAFEVIMITITSIIGMLGVSAGLEGYFMTDASIAERIIFIVSGLLLIDPGFMTDIIGLSGLILMYLIQTNRVRKLKQGIK